MISSVTRLRLERPHLEINGRQVAYEVIRSSRKKSIGIEICPHRGLLVRVPRQMPHAQIRRILRHSSGWIGKRFDLLQERLGIRGWRRFDAQEKIYFLGEKLTLEFFSSPLAAAEVKRENGALAIGLPVGLAAADLPAVIRGALVDWYRHQAAGIIRERVAAYAPEVGVVLPPIRISSARKRWGSCGGLGRLNFTWRVIMAPLSAVDYVVVHELCHLLRRDHSPEFWRLVGAVMPDYRRRSQQLQAESFVYDF